MSAVSPRNRAQPAASARTAEARPEHAPRPNAAAPQLWLPAGLRPPGPRPKLILPSDPQGGAAHETPKGRPALIIPDRYARPRTDAEHLAYRAIVQESRAFIDRGYAAKAERNRALFARFEEGAARRETTPPGLRPWAVALRGVRKEDDAPEVHREADGMTVNAPLPGRALDAEWAALIRLGMKAEVPHRKQIGGTCGLYALGMVMDAWHARDPRAPTALVQDEDLKPVDEALGYRHFTLAPTQERRMLTAAREAGVTAKGEMFDATQLAEVATTFGYRASVRHRATLDDVYAVLEAGHPAIVPFNVDKDGEAGTPDPGARAHYAVIEGHFDKDGERHLIARHSWSKSEHRVWKAADFEASWANLKTTRFYGTPGDGTIPNRPDLVEPARLALPDAGDGRSDISFTLARTLVEVVPPGQPLTGGREVGRPQDTSRTLSMSTRTRSPVRTTRASME